LPDTKLLSLVRRCDSRRRKSLSGCLINSTSRQRDCSSRISTLKDSGTPGSMAASPLDDGLVDLGTAIDVIGLGSQQLLQDVRHAGMLRAPHTSISPKRCPPNCALPPSGWLRDQRIRSDRTSVDLIVDQVGKLQHVDVAHSRRLLELSPVMPSNNGRLLPELGSSAAASSGFELCFLAPSNTAVPNQMPRFHCRVPRARASRHRVRAVGAALPCWQSAPSPWHGLRWRSRFALHHLGDLLAR